MKRHETQMDGNQVYMRVYGVFVGRLETPKMLNKARKWRVSSSLILIEGALLGNVLIGIGLSLYDTRLLKCRLARYFACAARARSTRNAVSNGTGRPVAPLAAPLRHAVPAMSKCTHV